MFEMFRQIDKWDYWQARFTGDSLEFRSYKRVGVVLGLITVCCTTSIPVIGYITKVSLADPRIWLYFAAGLVLAFLCVKEATARRVVRIDPLSAAITEETVSWGRHNQNTHSFDDVDYIMFRMDRRVLPGEENAVDCWVVEVVFVEQQEALELGSEPKDLAMRRRAEMLCRILNVPLCNQMLSDEMVQPDELNLPLAEKMQHQQGGQYVIAAPPADTPVNITRENRELFFQMPSTLSRKRGLYIALAFAAFLSLSGLWLSSICNSYGCGIGNAIPLLLVSIIATILAACIFSTEKITIDSRSLKRTLLFFSLLPAVQEEIPLSRT
jgi:hypothetical protein